jgi:hypothetical protein
MFCRSLFVLFYFFFWPLGCLFLFDIRILITPLVSSNSSFAHFIDCLSPIYGFWLPSCPFYWLSFPDLRLLITLLPILVTVFPRFTASDYPFAHFSDCLSPIYGFWLPSCPFYWLSFSDLRLLITLLYLQTFLKYIWNPPKYRQNKWFKRKPLINFHNLYFYPINVIFILSLFFPLFIYFIFILFLFYFCIWWKSCEKSICILCWTWNLLVFITLYNSHDTIT